MKDEYVIALRKSKLERQQNGYFPNCQPNARHSANFGTRTFPARLWQPFFRDTLHTVRLYQTFFTLYHTFASLSRVFCKKSRVG